MQQPKVVDYCPGVQGLTDRRCVAVTPVDVLLGCNKGGGQSRGAPERPNNFASIFFNTAHLLLNDLRFEHGDAKFLAPGAI